jgi:hypothetical protein
MKKMQKAKLNNWSFFQDSPSPYSAPEQTFFRMQGDVEGHPLIFDNEFIHTSPVEKVFQTTVHTRNTIYRLGRPDPGYVKCMKENYGLSMKEVLLRASKGETFKAKEKQS